MRVIAVDPGYDRVGIAILEKDHTPGTPNTERWLYSQTFTTPKDLPTVERIRQVGERIAKLAKEYDAACLAIETLFFNSNQKTAMQVAAARGVIIYAAQQEGLEIYEYSPQQIKIAVTGHGRADKRSVIDMTKRLVAVPEGTRLDDEFDAIACALTCFAHERFSS